MEPTIMNLIDSLRQARELAIWLQSEFSRIPNPRTTERETKSALAQALLSSVASLCYQGIDLLNRFPREPAEEQP